jgi:hypothetical protein
MTGGTVSGNLVAGGGCVLDGTHVTGNVSVAPTGSLVMRDGATVDGNVSIVNTSGANAICGSAIGGNLDVHNNSGTTDIGDPSDCTPPNGGNTIGGNLTVHNNSGQVTVSENVVSGILDCHADSPAVTGESGSNAAGGNVKGECVSLVGESVFVSVQCPKTGCTADASDGSTSVHFDVPGGGQAGRLSIALSPAPPDVCGGFEEAFREADPASPALVTYTAPPGYGPANPMIVDGTYPGDVSTICKNSGPGTPFVVLGPCGEEVSPPCILSGPTLDEGTDTTSYELEITSGDPSWGGI